MTLEIYATRVECIDSMTEDIVFKLVTFDEYTATLSMDTLVAPGEPLEELFNAIREAISKLDLK